MPRAVEDTGSSGVGVVRKSLLGIGRGWQVMLAGEGHGKVSQAEGAACAEGWGGRGKGQASWACSSRIPGTSLSSAWPVGGGRMEDAVSGTGAAVGDRWMETRLLTSLCPPPVGDQILEY